MSPAKKPVMAVVVIVSSLALILITLYSANWQIGPWFVPILVAVIVAVVGLWGKLPGQ